MIKLLQSTPPTKIIETSKLITKLNTFITPYHPLPSLPPRGKEQNHPFPLGGNKKGGRKQQYLKIMKTQKELYSRRIDAKVHKGITNSDLCFVQLCALAP